MSSEMLACGIETFRGKRFEHALLKYELSQPEKILQLLVDLQAMQACMTDL